jgi:hypothetical protein
MENQTKSKRKQNKRIHSKRCLIKRSRLGVHRILEAIHHMCPEGMISKDQTEMVAIGTALITMMIVEFQKGEIRRIESQEKTAAPDITTEIIS